MGVEPDQVADLLALEGRRVDNIPGAPGIGDKGARDLIQAFGSVEAALERAAEVERKTYRESLQNNREQIGLSKRLATIATDVPVRVVDSSGDGAHEPDAGALRQLYTELEFYQPVEGTGTVRGAGWRNGNCARSSGAAVDALAGARFRPSSARCDDLGSEGEGILAQTRLGLSAEGGRRRQRRD